MIHLLIASLLWAFSFGLIKRYLAGVDANLVATVRLLLSALLFVPLLRRKRAAQVPVATLVGIGALQYGVMYVAYIHAYRYLAGHEVALLTVLTPLYVTLVHDALERRFHLGAAGAATLAVAGAGIIVYRAPDTEGAALGVLLIQVSNACFAAGQVWYRRVMIRVRGGGSRVPDASVFGWLYLGGLVVAGSAALVTVDAGMVRLSGTQLGVLLYLGLLPSGVAFFLWNAGAARSRAGTLAAMNNLKVPLAVGVALVVFGEKADLVRLLVGGGVIIGAVAGYEWWQRNRSR